MLRSVSLPGSGRLWATLLAIVIVSASLRFAWLDRYPIGWHHDEALMGVMAGAVYRGEERPIFFRQYLGQEPLYIYLAAGMIGLLGGDEDVLPLRLTSALIGLLTVVLTFGLGRALFGTRVGLLAMALAGASFWQVMSARMAYRSITQPLIEAVSVYLLWQARRRGGLGWYALTGATLGSVVYTYLGARVFPSVFIGFGFWLLITRGWPSRGVLLRTAVMVGVALAVVAPLAAFFIANPGTFSARMDQVFILRPEVNGGDPWQLLAESTSKLLRSFTISGEPMWRYNISGRPMFVGALGLAFYGGLICLLHRLWRRDDAAALVLVWLSAMLFPSLLSLEQGAYTLRAMGVVPAVFFVPALGLDRLARRIGGLRSWGPTAARVILAGLLLVEVGSTARDYFVVWPPSFGALAEGHADAVAQALFLSREARPEQEEIFVASEYYHHPVLAQIARSAYPSLRWFDGRGSVAFSPDSGRPALYLLGFNGMPPTEEELFPPSALVERQDFVEGVDGGLPPPLLLAYRLTPDQVGAQVQKILTDPRLRPVGGRVPGLIEPLGARIDGPVRPGDEVSATVVWRITGRPPAGLLQITAQLLDYQWQRVSGVETMAYPPEEWRVGDVVWSRFRIPVPIEARPERYYVQLALYDLQTREPLPIEGGMPGMQALALGDVRVTAVEPPPLPERPIGARFGGGVDLVGIDAPAATEAVLTATLHWQTERILDQDYTVFVQLLDTNGRLVAQSDSWPANGALPTTAWLPGETVHDQHRLALRPDLPAGTYRLIAGLYLLASGKRLPTDGGDFVELAAVSIPSR